MCGARNCVHFSQKIFYLDKPNILQCSINLKCILLIIKYTGTQGRLIVSFKTINEIIVDYFSVSFDCFLITTTEIEITITLC